MEIYEQVPKLEAVVIPAAGQYGLLAGTAAAIKHLDSRILVIVSRHWEALWIFTSSLYAHCLKSHLISLVTDSRSYSRSTSFLLHNCFLLPRIDTSAFFILHGLRNKATVFEVVSLVSLSAHSSESCRAVCTEGTEQPSCSIFSYKEISWYSLCREAFKQIYYHIWPSSENLYIMQHWGWLGLPVSPEMVLF